MIEITIPEDDWFNEETEEFVHMKGYTLRMEHSLISLSKWESKWHKPFLVSGKKSSSRSELTKEELIDYFKAMTITKNIPDEAYMRLTANDIKAISNYISDPMSATTIHYANPTPSGKKETMTSELIYYNMIAANIPFSCEKWHLNRLLKLIEVCAVKNSPNKKMGKKESAMSNAALNKARRAKLGTKG